MAQGFLARIAHLEETHEMIERDIVSLGTNSEHELQVRELKKKKLAVKDEITKLRYMHEQQKEQLAHINTESSN